MWFGYAGKEPVFYEGKILDSYLPDNQIPTPIDDWCSICDTQFVEGDQGIRLIRPEGPRYWHIDCLNMIFDAAPA